MFRDEHIGKVNANPVGEHAAGTLVVVAYDCVRKLEPGWNLFESMSGCWMRVVDKDGNSPYMSIPMSVADLEGVQVEEMRRNGPLRKTPSNMWRELLPTDAPIADEPFILDDRTGNHST